MFTENHESIKGIIAIALAAIILVTGWCFGWNSMTNNHKLYREEVDTQLEKLEEFNDKAWEAMGVFIGEYYSDYYAKLAMESN